MIDSGAFESDRILQYAIEALDDVRDSRWSPEKWELFGDYVARMGEALDRSDLAEIALCRQQVEALETLQKDRAVLGGRPAKVPQPVRLREQADRLTERLEQGKGKGKGKGKDPDGRAGRPR